MDILQVVQALFLAAFMIIGIVMLMGGLSTASNDQTRDKGLMQAGLAALVILGSLVLIPAVFGDVGELLDEIDEARRIFDYIRCI